MNRARGRKPRPFQDRIVRCDYDGERAVFIDSAAVYGGRSFGMIWRCARCGAYVGVHEGTNNPLGRLANAELRRWKKAAHAAFDPLWRSGRMTRQEAYAHLQEIMGMTVGEAHIGRFDIPECRRLVQLLTTERSA